MPGVEVAANGTSTPQPSDSSDTISAAAPKRKRADTEDAPQSEEPPAEISTIVNKDESFREVLADIFTVLLK
jgi:hypothetical protein